jgi:hypothetical protein
MTDAAYPEPRIVESPAACPGLARLPRVPVRVLVLSAPEVEDPDKRGLVDRLQRRAGELGVTDGVSIVNEALPGWDLAPGGTERKRFDVVLLRPGAIPARAERSEEPDGGVVDVLSRVLGDLETRFWALDPAPVGAPEHEPLRRANLCRELVERGAPPVVLVPEGWEQDDVYRFHEDLLERVLHDSPLVNAVGRATAALRPVPTIYQPAGGRFGLDLGRLLEDHRRQIDEECSRLRGFQREVQAVRPSEEAPEARQTVFANLERGAIDRLDGLEQVRDAAEEINRDRDPAGWSRLATCIDQLRRIQSEARYDREQLQAFRLVTHNEDI